MRRDELLAWVGIVIGIPGLLVLFFTVQIAIGVFVVLIIGGLIWLRWYLALPDFTILEMEKRLVFKDPQAHKATFTRYQKARANHKGLTEFWIKGNSADGRIENVRIDDKDPDIQTLEAGDLAVCKRFHRPLERGQQEPMKLSYDIIDGFSGNPEGLIHLVSYKTKLFRMIIEFHEDRPCNSCRAFLRYGGKEHRTLPQPVTFAGGRRVEFEVKRPKLGAEYFLEWNW
jgi:hypothetical protein